ncbi:MAG: type I DNA topoisomerase [Christensenellaceae bacterium]|jgi:DNA topoisomerase-1|nr:type I DNA topoisomerase [Christensenellaceae bacterium]
MNLVIVESPAKAKTIQKYLGANFQVMASGGHVCDLPEKTLGIEIDNNFKPLYIINPDKVELVRKLKSCANKSETVFLATDPDREGEAISWHLANALELKLANRVEFNEISAKAVKNAIANPRDINMNLVDAQQARRVLDRLVGYKISPVLARKIKSGLSGGRVQSAALKMIVDREREILAFIPEEYWHIYAELNKLNDYLSIKALLSDRCGTKLKVTEGGSANSILEELKGSSDWFIDTVKRSVSKSRPLPPFMTSTLQQDASHKLNISAPQTMQIAQQLYEGIELANEGHVALVTYIRTDSVRVSPDMQLETLEYIKKHFGAEYAPSKPNIYETKSKNTQDAHEAIRPISLERTPESVKAIINRQQYRLYKLIYDRYVASQMTDATYNTLNVRIQANVSDSLNYGFKVSGRTLLFKGFTIAYQTDRTASEDEVDGLLPNLNEGDKLSLNKLLPEQKFTKPPARYTDSTLVKAMEENGIGRPSTYATVISVLVKRSYITKEEKMMIPTALGVTVTEFLEQCFANIVDTKFTAGMELKLDEIEQGSKWQKIIAEFYPPFAKDLKNAGSQESKKATVLETTDIPCEKCGAMMVIREGRFGRFMACPNYPTCKNSKNLNDSVGTCPKCGGDIIKRVTKNKKVFYGCKNYPNCQFSSWVQPAPVNCPKCGGMMRINKKNDVVTYICIDNKCKTVVKTEKDDIVENES